MALTAPRIEALRALATDDDLRVRVAGGCMAPEIVSGETVVVRAARRVWPGDVVVHAGADGCLTVHRVVGWRPRSWRRPWGIWDLWTHADHAAAIDAPVPRERVVGRLAYRPAPRERVAAVARLARHLVRRAMARIAGPRGGA